MTFNNAEDILLYARRAGLDPGQFRLEFLSSIRRAMLFASLRALEE